jgi:hypothetical protein
VVCSGRGETRLKDCKAERGLLGSRDSETIAISTTSNWLLGSGELKAYK